jgi:hypothetical protein
MDPKQQTLAKLKAERSSRTTMITLALRGLSSEV